MSKQKSNDLLESMRVEYSEVAKNFRTLTEIRFRLLAFLPIGTGLGILLTTSKNDIPNPFVSIFGLVITLALMTYNVRNDQLYGELAGRAAELERKLGLLDGNFNQRPTRWLFFKFSFSSELRVEHSWPINLIYKTSIIAWLYGIFMPIFAWAITKWTISNSPLGPPIPFLIGLSAIIISCLIVCCFSKAIKRMREIREIRIRSAAKKAVYQLSKLPFEAPKNSDANDWKKLFKQILILRGSDNEKKWRSILACASFYLSENFIKTEENNFYPTPKNKEEFGDITAAYIVALLSNLPVRWIIDTYYDRSGRRKCGPQNVKDWIEYMTQKRALS